MVDSYDGVGGVTRVGYYLFFFFLLVLSSFGVSYTVSFLIE